MANFFVSLQKKYTNIRNMPVSVKDKLRALDILKEYKGSNPYILMLQRDVIFKNGELNDFRGGIY